MDLFTRCCLCRSIIWGSSYESGKSKLVFCSDCAKCSQCHLKLTTPYYISKDNDNFCCSPCKSLLNEQAELEERIRKNNQRLAEIEELENQLREEELAPSCVECSTKIKSGDYYYATKQEPEKKVCKLCYKKRTLQLFEEVNDKVQQTMLKKEKVELTPSEWSLFDDRAKKIINDYNQKLEKRQKDQVPNQNNKSFWEEHWVSLSIGGGAFLIYLTAYFYLVGKKEGQKAKKKTKNE